MTAFENLSFRKNVMQSQIPMQNIAGLILFIRGKKVMLDSDLARLYGVETKALNRAVRRNLERFPEAFMFQLTTKEVSSLISPLNDKNLRCQIGTSSEDKTWGGRRYRPYVFTEQGVAMLSAVLKSKTAVQVSIAIMKAFVMLREILSSNKELAQKLSDLESRLGTHDKAIRSLFATIRQLMAPPPSSGRKIGFRTG